MLVPIDSKSSVQFMNVEKMTTRGQKWSKMAKNGIIRLIKLIIIMFVPIDSKSSVEFINVEKF